MKSTIYNGGLTREQFLFYEMRITARLWQSGMTKEEILDEVCRENLFQFPTERMMTTICRCCFRRLEALGSDELIKALASSTVEAAKQVNLYSMMKQNRIVYDFMLHIIGEKYRSGDLTLTAKDMNVFFSFMEEQDETVATWTPATLKKISQVLRKSLTECDFLDTVKSETLNPMLITPELEQGMRLNGDENLLCAFNCFM